MVKVIWQGDMAFEVNPPSGAKFTMDSRAEEGGHSLGPTPIETLLSAIAGCSAMDVISILKKQRQKVTSYHIEVEGDRPPPGQFPRNFSAIRVRHFLSGENLDPGAVSKAVELSDGKYCSVIQTLRAGTTVSSEWRIE